MCLALTFPHAAECRRREESKLKEHKPAVDVWGSETADVELDEAKVCDTVVATCVRSYIVHEAKACNCDCYFVYLTRCA